jgi:transcriptional regulator with XRE-family HTH domain
MSVRPSPTVRGRRLRAELRRLRNDRSITIEQVTARSDGDLTAAAVSRYETGERRINPAALRLLLDIYDVHGAEREALLTLAREARQRGWWQQFASEAVPEWFQVYVGLESEAASIRGYETELIPGLLQTPDYYRAFLREAPAAGDAAAIEGKVAVRAQRQERLDTDEPPALWVVMNEAVIRRVVGGDQVMSKQLRHIATMAERPDITVQVLQFRSGAHPAMEGSFMLLGFPEVQDPEIGYVEYQMGSLILEGPPEVARFKAMFTHLVAKALGPDESIAMIADAAAQLT